MGSPKTVKVTMELPEDILAEVKRRSNGDLSGYVLRGVRRQIDADRFLDEMSEELGELTEEDLTEARAWLAD